MTASTVHPNIALAQPSSHTILDACRVHDHREQEPLRIDRYVPFATFDLLPRVVAALPAFATVFTDGERSPRSAVRGALADGVAAREELSPRQVLWTRFHGGNAEGNCRHRQPVFST